MVAMADFYEVKINSITKISRLSRHSFGLSKISSGVGHMPIAASWKKTVSYLKAAHCTFSSTFRTHRNVEEKTVNLTFSLKNI